MYIYIHVYTYIYIYIYIYYLIGSSSGHMRLSYFRGGPRPPAFGILVGSVNLWRFPSEAALI